MAGGEIKTLKKRKKPKKSASEKEVVITLGAPKKEADEEEGTIKLSKDASEEEVAVVLKSPSEKIPEKRMKKAPVQDTDYDDVDGDESADDDVIVISLGAPPPKKEIVKGTEPKVISQEDIAEVEAVDAEVLEGEITEVEGGESEGEKKEEKERQPRKKQIAAVIIVVMVILGSIGLYYFVLQNQQPVARLTLNPGSAMAGELVTMDATDSSDDNGIIRYVWDFGDGGSYTETKDDAGDGKFDFSTTHSYEEVGDYSVTLTVWDDDDKKDKTVLRIEISELIVTVPIEMIDDAITYDINGTIDVSDPDGLATFPSPVGDIKVKKINLEYEGYMDSSIEGTITQEDGFFVSHDTLEKNNNQDVTIDGTVSGTIELSGAENPFDFPIDQGTLIVNDRAHIDLTTNKTIFSFTHSEFKISAGSDLGIESIDDLSTYSNLRAEPAVLRVEDLSSDRTFEIGQKQTKIIGEIAYSWEVERATNINSYPALMVNIDIDEGTKSDLGLEEFVMEMYISNDISFPVKTYIYSKFDWDGTETEIVYNSEIQQDGFERGEIHIPWGTCTTSSPDGHYHRRNPDFEFVSWGPGDLLPDMGSNSTNFDFIPQDAINWGRSDSTAFDNYLSQNPDAYLIDGYYNETQDNPAWNLTFGELGDDTGYYIIEEYDGAAHSVVDQDTIDIPDVMNTTDDFDLVLSYSAGQKVFQEEDEVNSLAFANGDVKYFDDIRYGSRADLVYPTISLTISLAIERTGYGYYLNKEDGTLSAAVDAINGQYIYVWKHSGDDVMSVIFGL
jgi:PKD repeat protein